MMEIIMNCRRTDDDNEAEEQEERKQMNALMKEIDSNEDKAEGNPILLHSKKFGKMTK